MNLTDFAPDVLASLGPFSTRVVAVDGETLTLYVEESVDTEQIGQTIDFEFDDLVDMASAAERSWDFPVSREEVEQTDAQAWEVCHATCDTVDNVPHANCGVIGNEQTPQGAIPRPCPPLLDGNEELATLLPNSNYRYIWRFGRLEGGEIRSKRMQPSFIMAWPFP